LTSAEIKTAFDASYLDVAEPYVLVGYTHSSDDDGDRLVARFRVAGEEREIGGEGNGPIAALVHGMGEAFGIDVHVREYHEHAMGKGEDATAAAYVEADVDDEAFWGVGIHSSIVTASLRAVVNAVNRGLAARAAQAAIANAFGGSSG
jgi:2-isopropylmalate synthase